MEDDSGEVLRIRRPKVTAAVVAFVAMSSLLVLIIAFAVHGWRECRDSKYWPAAEGVVTYSRIEREVTPLGFLSKPVVRYEYTLAGKVYEGDRIRHGMDVWYYRSRRADEHCDRYRTGRPVRVHWDPDNPSSSALEVGEPGLDFYLGFVPLLCFWGVFWAASAVGLAYAVKKQRLIRRAMELGEQEDIDSLVEMQFEEDIQVKVNADQARVTPIVWIGIFFMLLFVLAAGLFALLLGDREPEIIWFGTGFTSAATVGIVWWCKPWSWRKKLRRRAMRKQLRALLRDRDIARQEREDNPYRPQP
jgi:hypothetical protein